MSDRSDETSESVPEPDENTPTVTCRRCDREWTVDYELDELNAGNRALEQFALDHRRHAGHFPDDVTPWEVDCRHCPDGERFLAERPARRWAATHARHTRHVVDLRKDGAETTAIEPAE
ncbi:MAG: hypothetical protein ABEI96_05835 [Haloarculaceae archaeon]